jgi:hypothetical protein
MSTVSDNEYDKCNNCGKKTGGIEDFKNPKTGRINKTCSSCRERVLKSVTSKVREVKRKMTLREQNSYLRNILKDQDKSFLTKLEKKYEYLPTIMSVNDFNFQKVENIDNEEDMKEEVKEEIKEDIIKKDVKKEHTTKRRPRLSQKELDEIKTKYPNLIIQVRRRGRPKKSVETKNED